MVANKKYKITKRIKIHTSPLFEVDVVQEGKFIKETAKYFVFDTFRVLKQVVISIEQIAGDNK